MTILDRIVETKQEEVAEAKRLCPLDVICKAAQRSAPPRAFGQAVSAPTPYGVQLIAEIKKSSPSAGLIVKEKSMEFLHRPAGKAKGANPWGILESFRDIVYYWFKWVVLRRLPKPIRRGYVLKRDGSYWPETPVNLPKKPEPQPANIV